jgi:hypothetical protein
MITFEQFLKAAQYRIIDGYEYMWDCFGDHVRALECSDTASHEAKWYASILFDTRDQTIYEVTVSDYANERYYRMIRPEYLQAYKDAAVEHNTDYRVIFDDTTFIDLEDDDDFLRKMTAIVQGEDYDTRIVVPVDLEDDVLFELMKEAHKQDITFNQYMQDIVKTAIDEQDEK